MLNPDTILAAIGLICRLTLPPCLRNSPAGFHMSSPATRLGNALAWRAGSILHLCASYNIIGTSEQPAESVMYDLQLHRRLFARGYRSVQFRFCSFGALREAIAGGSATGTSCSVWPALAVAPGVEPTLQLNKLSLFLSQCTPQL